ncbi:MAG: Fe-S cluster assembly ATPase SufC [Candidatus Aminicenantia bacterium]
MKEILRIENLHVKVEDKEILKGINLRINEGETHALMGPNGTGKSTLAFALMGRPNYIITNGKVFFKGEDITNLSTFQRAKKGLFLAFQYPEEIEGVFLENFIRTSYNSINNSDVSVLQFRKLLLDKMKILEMEIPFLTRYVNMHFSGGEKKRSEILQMAILKPALSILDEPDSGLDIDALRVVANGIKAIKEGPMSFLIITHYQRILHYIEPDFVHVIIDGRIVLSGEKELAKELEAKGYEWVKNGENRENARSI